MALIGKGEEVLSIIHVLFVRRSGLVWGLIILLVTFVVMSVKKCMSDDEFRTVYNSSTLEQYNNRGVAWAKNGNYDKAIEEFTRSIKRFPDAPESYYNRGQAYYNI
jgi:tetratricopeptide (TPR) repeat protein